MSPGRIELSDVQKRVIDHDRGHLRIVACPGSGKTETVSRRVAELVKKGVKPSTIVAFTFTNKAADGLKSRIRMMLEEWGGRRDVGDMYVGTIDSFCLYMLKKIKPEYRSFEILDSARRAAFVDRWYNVLGLANLGAHKWRTIEKFYRSVDRAVTEGVDMSSVSNEAFVSCYETYTKKLREEKFFDFISIIATLLDVLERDPDALAQVGKEVKHVVFDEYQDVNKLQETLLGFLSSRADSVCVVGDDDQNIFQWRGSDISHIRDFPARYDKHSVTTENLGVNYRATDALVRSGRQTGLAQHEPDLRRTCAHTSKQGRVRIRRHRAPPLRHGHRGIRVHLQHNGLPARNRSLKKRAPPDRSIVPRHGGDRTHQRRRG